MHTKIEKINNNQYNMLKIKSDTIGKSAQSKYNYMNWLLLFINL